MLWIFNTLDRMFDTLAHMFDGMNEPASSRSRPEAALFMIGLILAGIAALLETQGLPESVAVWALAILTLGLGWLCIVRR